MWLNIISKSVTFLNVIIGKLGIKTRILNPWSHQKGNASAFRINHLLSKFQNPSYLEIGIYSGFTFELIHARKKIAVDPVPRCCSLFDSNSKILKYYSDDFFLNLDPMTLFNGVFIDGLHEFRQVYRDIENSLAHLHSEGFILVDDVWPVSKIASTSILDMTNAERTLMESNVFSWQGDVYKAIELLYRSQSELEIRILNSLSHCQALIQWKKNSSMRIARVTESDFKLLSLEFEKKFDFKDYPRNWKFVEEQVALA